MNTITHVTAVTLQISAILSDMHKQQARARAILQVSRVLDREKVTSQSAKVPVSWINDPELPKALHQGTALESFWGS